LKLWFVISYFSIKTDSQVFNIQPFTPSFKSFIKHSKVDVGYFQ